MRSRDVSWRVRYAVTPECILTVATPDIAMIETQTFRLNDYELTCSAHATDNGRFEPVLVISKSAWPSRPRTIAVQRGAHPSAELAIAAAHAQGIEWVRNYG